MNYRNVKTLTLNDPQFPDGLKQINPVPKQLFVAGEDISNWIDKPKVAIVGSRKASAYGKAVTEMLAGGLGKAGAVIISGLAYGIDAAAHAAALKGGGITVAVLGTPVSKIYPAGHLHLAHQIVSSGGSIISESSEGEQIYKTNFIARNRIISGLADVIIIAEAASRSGSLSTARFGLDQGKTVMAVPGNITNPGSAGCNNLIKSGAVPVTDLEDVLFALGIKAANKPAPTYRGTAQEEIIFNLIARGITSQEDLAVASKLAGPQVNSALTMLEIAGVIRPAGNGRWSLV